MKTFLNTLLFTISSIIGLAQDQHVKWITIDTLNQSSIIGGQWMPEIKKNRMGRLPDSMKNLVREPVWNLSQQTAGEYLDFYTNSDEIQVEYEVNGGLNLTNMSTTGVSGMDLYMKSKDGKWFWAAGNAEFGKTLKITFKNLLHDKGSRYRLYFPLYNNVKNLKIGIKTSADIKILKQLHNYPIIVYGTSIAQGASASRSGMAWTNILSRHLEHDVINLGFSGNGKLETPILDFILQNPSRLIALDCLPNLPVNKNTLNRQQLFDTIVTAVKYIRNKTTNTPILLVQHSGATDTAFSIENFKNQEFLQATIVADSAFRFLKSNGVQNIFQLEASDFQFNTDCTIDGIHPNDLGMQKIADAYERKIREILHLTNGGESTTTPTQQFREYPGYDWMERHKAVLENNKKSPPKLIILGNSIMHFWSGHPIAYAQRGKDSWEKYIEKYQPVNMGFGWDRIENMLWRVQNGEMDGYKAEKIFIMAGTNNLSIGSTDEDIIIGLKFLINEIKFRQPNATIYLSGIFPRKDFEQRIQVLNSKLEKLAQEQSVNYHDFSAIFTLKNGKIDESLFTDGLHPNTKGYMRLGKKLDEIIK